MVSSVHIESNCSNNNNIAQKLFVIVIMIRDEQYHLLWSELETISDKYQGLSEQHRILHEIISQATRQSPSYKITQNVKGENL